MIASVPAREAAKAQTVNLCLSGIRIVIYRFLADRLTRPQVSWNAPPRKVKALYGTGQPISEIRRVGLLGIAALNGR